MRAMQANATEKINIGNAKIMFGCLSTDRVQQKGKCLCGV